MRIVLDAAPTARNHRRNLTDSQRAMIAAELANLPVGNPDFSPITPYGVIGAPAVTRAEVKDLMQVSEGSLHRAKVIQRDGTCRKSDTCSGHRTHRRGQ